MPLMPAYLTLDPWHQNMLADGTNMESNEDDEKRT